MARDFDGSTGKLTANGIPLAGPPMTVAGWFWLDALSGTTQAIFGIGNAVNNRGITLFYNGPASGDPLHFFYRADNNQTVSVLSSVNLTAGGWIHVAATLSADGKTGEVFINGVSRGTATNALATAAVTLTRTGIGVQHQNVDGMLFDGRLAEIAIWNAVLDSSLIVTLAGGANPSGIQEGDLSGYWRILGDENPEPDSAGSLDLTLTGTAPQIEHPPVEAPVTITPYPYRPFRRRR